MTIRRAVALAAALGLLGGLIEGVALFSLQQAGWLGWRIARVRVSSEILIVSALWDLLLFLAVAAVLIVVARAVTRLGPKLPLDALVLYVCCFLLCFDWLTLTGRLRLYAVVPLSIGLAGFALRWYSSHSSTSWKFACNSIPWLVAATVFLGMGTYGRAWLSQYIAIASLPAPAPDSPSVLVVVLDTVRSDHLSSYGYDRATSPFLDRFAQEGALFENAYSTSSWTLPAHASLLTGLLPHEHGATTSELDESSPMISEAVLARGYRTAAFSANLDWFTRAQGFSRGFIQFADLFQSLGDAVGRTVYGRMWDEYVAERWGIPSLRGRVLAADINRAALRWLDKGPSSAPFFLVLNYFDAHGPYTPPPPYRQKFSVNPNPGGLLHDVALRRRPQLTQAQLQGEIDAYDGAIAYLDRQFQELIGELGRRGVEDNTIVIVTSDHGESFGEHGLFTHRTALYRELVHVPLIVRWPGHVPSDTRVDVPVSITDIPATLRDLLDIPPTNGIRGQSLATAWMRPTTRADRRFLVQELARMPFEEFNWVPAYYGALTSVIASKWHYIEHETLGAELYDLQHDPHELSNLIDTQDGSRVSRELAEYLRASKPDRQNPSREP
jgi:arylsulfatase A-like enzyme